MTFIRPLYLHNLFAFLYLALKIASLLDLSLYCTVYAIAGIILFNHVSFEFFAHFNENCLNGFKL